MVISSTKMHENCSNLFHCNTDETTFPLIYNMFYLEAKPALKSIFRRNVFDAYSVFTLPGPRSGQTMPIQICFRPNQLDIHLVDRSCRHVNASDVIRVGETTVDMHFDDRCGLRQRMRRSFF